MEYFTRLKLLWIALGAAMLATGFSLVQSVPRLSAFPRVCQIKDGQTCSVEIQWQGPPRSCVFAIRDQQSNLLGCSSFLGQGRKVAPWINKQGVRFELRENSDPESALLGSLSAYGIDIRSAPSQVALGPADVQKERTDLAAPSFLSSSWDGRLYFSAVGTTGGAYAWSVQVMRPEKFEGADREKFNFLASETFSPGFLLDSDYLLPEVADQLKLEPRFKLMGGLEKLGPNLAKMQGRLHMAVYPHPGLTVNPYRSNSGGRAADAGGFETYRFFIICAPNRLDDGTQDTVIVPATGQSRHFLAKLEVQVVVKNPRKTDASIYSTRIVNSAQAIRNSTGNLVIGYEPSASLDGQLIVFSGTPKPENRAQGGRPMYIYNPNPYYALGWTVAAPITSLYWLQGPGKWGGESSSGGLPFSQRFPLARYPIRDDQGVAFNFGDSMLGSYPWLSPDASEVVTSTIPAFNGAARRGTVIVGARTLGKIQHIDGLMNPSRGNPDPGRYFYSSVNPVEHQRLVYAYDHMPRPNSVGGSPLPHSYENVLFSMVLSSPGSWNAFSELKKPPLPLSREPQVYGLIMSSGNRYAEIPIIEQQQDLLLAMPMNESITFNRAVINTDANTPGGTGNVLKSQGATYSATETPDLSPYHHTGLLRGGAQFPFEYYKVQEEWTARQILLDRSEGAHGNSIFMRSGSYVEVPMKPEALNRVFAQQDYSISLWFRKSGLPSASVLHWPGIISVETTADQLLVKPIVNEVAAPPPVEAPAIPSIRNKWVHLAVTFHQSHIAIYVDGEKKIEYRAIGILKSQDVSLNSPLWLGPKTGTVGRVDIDEVFIYASKLREDEIHRLARRPEIETEWEGVSTDLIRSPGFLGKVAQIPQDNPYHKPDADLGKLLFQSNDLSHDRTVSCASCHRPEFAFGDSVAFSKGIGGQLTQRNSPSLINLAFNKSFFWDGSAPTLESQVIHPIINAGEMGMDQATLIDRLSTPEWLPRFQAVYQAPPSLTLVSRALASFVRGIGTGSTAFDLESDHRNLNAAQMRGWRIFSGRANCISCHSGPAFSDGKMHDTGLASLSTPFPLEADLGAGRVSGRRSEMFAMKTPSLRNVGQSAPYFHDGRLQTLEEVVDFYNRGGDPQANTRPTRSPFIRPLNMKPADKTDLVEFLKSLSGQISP